MTAEAPTARRLCWIYPDRGTAAQRATEHEAVWDRYRAIAEDMGLEMSLHTPEEVAIDARDPRAPRFFLRGERITPEDTILVTHFYTLPHQSADATNQATLYTSFEQAGFYLPIPPKIAFVGRDKLATMLFLADSPVPTLPTVRIGSGRAAMTGHYDVALEGLAYPLIVKPAYWGMGLGVSVVSNVHDLRGVIGLAGGSDTALVVQPYLGEVREGRIFVVDGEPHTVLEGQKEGYCIVSTRALGGRLQRDYVDVSPQMEEAVAYAASRLRIPYFTLDYLHDGERYWISEIEPDGAVGFNQDARQEEIGGQIVTDRFYAFLRGHRDWIAARGTR